MRGNKYFFSKVYFIILGGKKMKKKILGIVLSVSIVLSLFVGMGITPVSATTIPISSGRVAYESFEYMTDSSAANFFTASNEGEATVTQNIITGGKSGKALALSVNLPNALSKVNYQSSEITFSNDVAGVKLWYNLDKEVTGLKFGLFDLTANEWTDIVFTDYTAGNHEKELYFYSFVGSNFDYSHEYVLALEDCGDADSAKSYVLTIDDFNLIKTTNSSSEHFDNKATADVSSYFSGSKDGSATVTQYITENGGANGTKALQVDMNLPWNWVWVNYNSKPFSIANDATHCHVWYSVNQDMGRIKFQLKNYSMGSWTDMAFIGTSSAGGSVAAGTYDSSINISGRNKSHQFCLGLEAFGGTSSTADSIPMHTLIIDNILFVKYEVYNSWNFDNMTVGSSNLFSKIATNNAIATQSIADNGEDSTKALAVKMEMPSKFDRVNLVSKALDIPYEACGVRVWYHLDKDVSNFRFGLKNATTDTWTNLMFEGSKTDRVTANAGTYADKILYLNGSEFDFANQYALAVEALGVDGESVDCTLTIDNITFITKTNIGMQQNFEGIAAGTYNYFANANTQGRATVQTVVENAGRNGSKALRVALGSGSAGWYNIHTNNFTVPSNVVGMRIWFKISCDAKVRVQMKKDGGWVNNIAFVGGSDGQVITAGTYCKTISYSASSNATYALGLEVQAWATGNSPVVEIDDFQFIYADSYPSNNFDSSATGTLNYFSSGNKASTATYSQTVVANSGMYNTNALQIQMGGSGWVNIQTTNFEIPSGVIGMHAWYKVSADCSKLRFQLRDTWTGDVWTSNAFEGTISSGTAVKAGTYDKTIFFSGVNTGVKKYQLGLEVNGIPDGGVTITLDSIEFIYGVGSAPATTAQFNTFKSDIASLNNFDHEDYLNNDSLTAYNTVYTIANSIPQSAVVNSTLNEIKAELATAKSAIVMKAEQQAPVAPVITNRTSKKLTLSEVAGCEYSIDGTNWAVELSYADLTTGNTYTVYQRVSRTDTHLASPASTLDVKLYAAGDIDNSDSVNATDLLALKKHLLGINKAQDEVFDNFAANANEDEDGTIDIRDLVAIKKIASGEVA